MSCIIPTAYPLHHVVRRNSTASCDCQVHYIALEVLSAEQLPLRRCWSVKVHSRDQRLVFYQPPSGRRGKIDNPYSYLLFGQPSRKSIAKKRGSLSKYACKWRVLCCQKHTFWLKSVLTKESFLSLIWLTCTANRLTDGLQVGKYKFVIFALHEQAFFYLINLKIIIFY